MFQDWNKRRRRNAIDDHQSDNQRENKRVFPRSTERDKKHELLTCTGSPRTTLSKRLETYMVSYRSGTCG